MLYSVISDGFSPTGNTLVSIIAGCVIAAVVLIGVVVAVVMMKKKKRGELPLCHNLCNFHNYVKCSVSAFCH